MLKIYVGGPIVLISSLSKKAQERFIALKRYIRTVFSVDRKQM